MVIGICWRATAAYQVASEVPRSQARRSSLHKGSQYTNPMLAPRKSKHSIAWFSYHLTKAMMLESYTRAFKCREDVGATSAPRIGTQPQPSRYWLHAALTLLATTHGMTR
ncbi:unnamed protein product, partial [Brenthis ino]